MTRTERSLLGQAKDKRNSSIFYCATKRQNDKMQVLQLRTSSPLYT